MKTWVYKFWEKFREKLKTYKTEKTFVLWAKTLRIPANNSRRCVKTKISSYVSGEAFWGKNHAKYEYMKFYVKLNFPRLLLAGFWKLYSKFSFLGSIWKFILQNTPLKKVEMENSSEESSHSVEKNFPSRIFTIGKNTSRYSLFNELNCAKSAKKSKSIFAVAWQSCRNENQKIWKILLLKLRSLHFYINNSEALDIQSLFAAETYRKNSSLQLKTPVQNLWVSLLRLFQVKLVEKFGAIKFFFQIDKKFEMPRKAWILRIVAEKQKQVLLDLNWSWVFAEKSHIK